VSPAPPVTTLAVSAKASAAAPTPSTRFAATLASALRARPSIASCTVSTVNVLKVVSPPANPVSRMSWMSVPRAEPRPSTTPAMAEPTTFTMSTAQGMRVSSPRRGPASSVTP
jgi:hypothetical protein